MYSVSVIQTESGYYIKFEQWGEHILTLPIDKEQAEEMESNGFIIESK